MENIGAFVLKALSWKLELIEFVVYKATGGLITVRLGDHGHHSRERIILVGGTALTTILMYRMYQSIPPDGMYEGLKRRFFKVIRSLPGIREKIEEEMGKAERSLENEMASLYGKNGTNEFIVELPELGMGNADILKLMKEYLELGNKSPEEHRLSGAHYYGTEDLTNLCTQVYQETAWSNTLHYEIYPGICKMEAEIVRMVLHRFHGDNDACGSVTSGGTESILLAVKACRDYARKFKGIDHPEILVPRTAHAAFDKAAQVMGIVIKHAPVNPKTCQVDVKRMAKMITGNTCMLVGSAPAYPHGCMDDIEQIGKLGEKYNIPVHVDACLGGFVIIFMEDAGYELPPFDFRVPGVTSISADTHKYGFAPKGSSVLMFRSKKLKECQYSMESNWPGGLYASATLAGSKPGSIIAGCWATLLHFGSSGYVQAAGRIVNATRFIYEHTRKIKGIYVMGEPGISVVSWGSDVFDIYILYDAMKKKGWTLNALQFPPGIHIGVSYPQTMDSIPETFVKDMEDSVKEIMENPNKVPPDSGAAAIYGTSQKIPFRELVDETAAFFLHTLYKTNF